MSPPGAAAGVDFDSHGVRYLIPDVRRLDAASRRILDHFLQ